MAVGTITKPGSTTAFSRTAVEAKLRDALLESANSDASLKGIALPSDAIGQAAASVRLDSLDVVNLLCDIEPIVGFELKDSLVRAGGYNSVNQAMDHLMPRIELAWEKNGNKGSKK
jgi:acyl carrier protein